MRILHVLRAPLGGLFRHVADLARAQTERGHLVGVIADSRTASPDSEAALQELKAHCKLGLLRIPMSRHIGLIDRNAIRHVAARAQETKADVLHGHGAKGGAYVRLARSNAVRVYTPHGGSLHYAPRSPLGLLYLSLEKQLARRTDLFLFESKYGLAVYRAKVGEPSAPARVVPNGVRPEEFEPIVTDADAADVVFVGELRKLKGVGVLIDALARSKHNAVLFGDGPDATAFRAEVAKRGLSSRISFAGAKPAREAFRQGRLLVVPSLAESFPYIVLEAAAAGMPMVATKVGGIPEIYGPDADELVASDAPGTLAEVISARLKKPQAALTARLKERIAGSFTVSAMTDGVLQAYDRALELRARGNR